MVTPVVRRVARVAAIGWTCGWSAAPVVSDDLVLLAAFSHALDPLWTIAVDPPDLGYAARIADSRLAVGAATVAGHRAYLRGRGHLTTIEW